ncbi:MAG: hypothetical protein Q9159_006453 [Coniocarpon cinnabarinum]
MPTSLTDLPDDVIALICQHSLNLRILKRRDTPNDDMRWPKSDMSARSWLSTLISARSDAQGRMVLLYVFDEVFRARRECERILEIATLNKRFWREMSYTLDAVIRTLPSEEDVYKEPGAWRELADVARMMRVKAITW